MRSDPFELLSVVVLDFDTDGSSSLKISLSKEKLSG